MASTVKSNPVRSRPYRLDMTTAKTRAQHGQYHTFSVFKCPHNAAALSINMAGLLAFSHCLPLSPRLARPNLF